MRKPYVPANAVLWAATAIAAAVLDAPHVFSQILLPLLAVFSVTAAGPDACLKRGGRP
ncbi:hypothetical protein [Rhodanobacter sp. DHB23]|uniref:hypothetical protein n=1 Tax=Rhodanobacter sp. DHB23 TaxID=2775923 RepID=UPI0017855C02|nr:hypothetical protein [Rhodanobacter sp. DHB23]MBD8874249.1 hypothetical protein [Rhodanobacter sp. DHB23]